MTGQGLGTGLTNVKDLLAHAISEVPYIRPDPYQLPLRNEIGQVPLLRELLELVQSWLGGSGQCFIKGLNVFALVMFLKCPGGLFQSCTPLKVVAFLPNSVLTVFRCNFLEPR